MELEINKIVNTKDCFTIGNIVYYPTIVEESHLIKKMYKDMFNIENFSADIGNVGELYITRNLKTDDVQLLINVHMNISLLYNIPEIVCIDLELSENEYSFLINKNI